MLSASTYFNRKSDLGEVCGKAVFGDGKRNFYLVDWCLCDDCEEPTVSQKLKATVQGHKGTIKAPEDWIRQGFEPGDYVEDAIPANMEAWAFEPGPDAEYDEGFLCVDCQRMVESRKGGE